MPSTATITSFYTFTANTKARASQVNNNFSAFRGHIFPIDPNTVTGANNTYDIGSAEYNWRSGYIGKLYLGATTTSWLLKDATTTGGGNLEIYKNGSLMTTFQSSYSPTTSAAIGGYARSAAIYQDITTITALNIAGSTITIQTAGKPVDLFFDNPDLTNDTTIRISRSATASSHTFDLYINVCRNTTTSIVARYRYYRQSTFSTITSFTMTNVIYETLDHRFVDNSAPAGTNNYFLQGYCGAVTSSSYNINNLALAAKEWK